MKMLSTLSSQCFPHVVSFVAVRHSINILPIHIDFLFVELHVTFSLAQDSAADSELHDVLHSDTVVVVFLICH